MPLPVTIPREKLHQRSISCEGFVREDGLWDIEAHLLDFRSYDCSYHPEHRGGLIRAGEPVHDMWVRITVDLDFVIHAAHAVSDATPFPVCQQAAQAMQELVGLQISAGWMREVRRRIGNTSSCTHLMDLLGPLSATAYQTLHKALEERAKANAAQTQTVREKPQILDTCLALAADGEVVRQRWPEFYTGDTS